METEFYDCRELNFVNEQEMAFLLEPLVRNVACQHLGFSMLSFRTVK